MGTKWKKDHFSKITTNSPNSLVGGRTPHKCYILYIRFYQFFKGNLVRALKLIVLF